MGLFDFLKTKAPEIDLRQSAAFVISSEGEFFSDPSGRATDLQLADGASEVTAAGRWVVAKGKVLAVTNESPAFRPSLDQMRTAISQMSQMGLDVSGGDGKGVLVVVYAELDSNGRGKTGTRYRAVKSAGAVNLVAET